MIKVEKQAHIVLETRNLPHRSETSPPNSNDDNEGIKQNNQTKDKQTRTIKQGQSNRTMAALGEYNHERALHLK